MIDEGKRVAAGGARFQWHTLPIADIDLIARNRLADVVRRRGLSGGESGRQLRSTTAHSALLAADGRKRWQLRFTSDVALDLQTHCS
jgi:hypothetical protein